MRSDAKPIVRNAGQYLVGGEIAAGGMATVHFGQLVGPAGFRRTVAIKRLHPSYAADPEFVAMFLNEARLAARIAHPNVATTLDVAAEGDGLVLVMEYVHGAPLSRLLKNVWERDGEVPLAVASSVASSVLYGLHAAHEARDDAGQPLEIVHRDVSPQNIMVGADGITRVVDFGIAKAVASAKTTRQGQLKGKLSYMAPEQLRGDRLDRRADLFAAGAVLWEMLSGRRLFEDGRERVLGAAVVVPRLDTLRSGLPAGVDQLVQRALSADREDRFTTARQMAVALELLIAPASPMAVGEWIARVAGDEIDARAAQLTELERRHRSDVATGETAPGVRVWDVATVVPSPAPAASTTEPTNLPARVARRPLRWAIVPAIAATAALIAFVAYRERRAATPEASTEGAVTAAGASSAAVDDVTSREPRLDGAPRADLGPPKPSAGSAPSPPSTRKVTGSSARRPPSDRCDPPYTVEADGVRRFKIDCVAPPK